MLNSLVQQLFKAVGAIPVETCIVHLISIFKDLSLQELTDILKLRLLKFVVDSISELISSFSHKCSSDISNHSQRTRQSTRGDMSLAK